MKKLLSMATVAALLITGCASSELKVTPAKGLTVEYGDKLDNSQLFNSKESDENLKVETVSGYDAKKLGDQELTVIFSDGNKEKEEKITITVKDTKAPMIELKKDTVTIKEGDELKLQDNVKAAKDPVDGDLKYSEKEIEKDGYYFDKGKLDTEKTGTYDVNVVAIDKNGNKTEKKFSVKIEKKKEEKKEASNSNSSNKASSSSGNSKGSSSSSSSKPSSNGSSASSKPNNNESSSKPSGSNSSGNSSSKPSIGGSSASNKPTQHEHYPVWGWDLGDIEDGVWSGMWFDTKQEAAAYAEGPYLDQYTEEHDGGGFNYQFEECGYPGCTKYTMYYWNFR